MNLSKIALGVLACAFICSLGCKAKPAPDSGFLKDPKLMSSAKGIPFNRMYLNPAYVKRDYTEIYIAPVHTDYVMAQNIWEKSTLANVNKADVKKNVNLLAEYTRQAFIKEVQKNSKRKLKPVDKPGKDTLIVELAIVQLVPSKAEMQALGYVSWIPTVVMIGGSAASKSEDQGKGVIAIEGRARDGQTNAVTMMFADREHPPTAIIDLKALMWWEPSKPIIDAWARQFVAINNNPDDKKIKQTSNFELLVW